MPVESTKSLGGLAYEIKASGFTLRADVPLPLGGQNSGPNPHDYLEVALASCTAITLQMYARRKGLPLESCDVKVKITAEGASNEIEREIRLLGKLDEAQKQALFAIAEKCPVHKLLAAGAKISSRLA